MIDFKMLLISGFFLACGIIPWLHVHRHPRIPDDPVRGDAPRLTAVCTVIGFFCLMIAVPPWLDGLARVFHGAAGTSVLGVILVVLLLLFRYQVLRRHKPAPERRWWQRKKKNPSGGDMPERTRPREIYYHRVFAMAISILLGVIAMVSYARGDALRNDAKTSPSTTLNSANAAAQAVRSGKAGHSLSGGGEVFALATLVLLIAGLIIAMTIHHRRLPAVRAAAENRKARRASRRKGGGQQSAGRGQQAPAMYGPQPGGAVYGPPAGGGAVYGPPAGAGGAVPAGRNPRALGGGKRG